jgi:ABC-type nickel/cobalt efflux system permease component RcnA
MVNTGAALLVGAVAAVGVLHTAVPDHWAPIALLARQRGWTRLQAARAAAGAGLGHTLSTLVIAVIVWLGGVALAARVGHLVSVLASLALLGFGAWIAIGALRELRAGDAAHTHGHARTGHRHAHRHPEGVTHEHWHEHLHEHEHDEEEHERGDAHAQGDREHEHGDAQAHGDDEHEALAAGGVPAHQHAHETSSRTALLLILGSSPMIEGIPAFFAASRYGVGQLALMASVFALATIATYVGLVLASVAGLSRIQLGPIERYGEVLSGAFIAVLGLVFLFVPL